MKFPRNARIFRGQLDAAPFAAVFFLLVIFALLTSLVYTPGVHVTLPSAPAADIAGVDGPTVAVAVDKVNQIARAQPEKHFQVAVTHFLDSISGD